MYAKFRIILIILLSYSINLSSQSLFEKGSGADNSRYRLNGFVRGAGYLGLDGDSDPYFQTSIADIGLKLSAGDGLRYRGYIDVRYRYGTENRVYTGDFRIHEAWAAIYTQKVGFTFGQQIVKWGEAEFFNTTDLLNSKNDLVRSPDIEDRDLGNLLGKIDINISDNLTIQLVGIPYFSYSKLYTGMISSELPLTTESDPDLYIENSFSFGIRSSLLLRGFEASFYWYNGQFHMPGIVLNSITFPAQPENLPELELYQVSYRRRLLSTDMAISPENNILKAGISYIINIDSDINTYAPLSDQVNWFGNFERSIGNLNVIVEYGGSKVLDYMMPDMEAVLPDINSFTDLPPMTPEEISAYISTLIDSFNRLYHYQYKESYHQIGVALNGSNSAMTLFPEIRAVYNFTTDEIMIRPQVSYKPFDNVNLSCGFEYWQGPENSIFQLIHNRANSLIFGIKIDF